MVFAKLNNLQLNKISKYLKQLPIVSNMFAPVPLLQICIWTNRVTAQCLFPPWSLLSSVSNENLLTIMVVFIRPDGNVPAISLSGNNSLTNFVEWSATENGRLCWATNCANFTSAVSTLVDRSFVFEVTKKDLICGCVFEWRTASYLPPNNTFTCTLHTLQYANIAPLSLAHIKSIWVTHTGWYFSAYFLFFAELSHSESDARFAILASFQSNEQRIRRLIKLDFRSRGGEQPIKFDLKRQAHSRLFTESMCKQYVVITLQAQACYRKWLIRINIDCCSLRLRWNCGRSGFPRGSSGDLMWMRESLAECGKPNMYAFSRIKCFVLSISWWPLCASSTTLSWSFVGTTIFVPFNKSPPPVKVNSLRIFLKVCILSVATLPGCSF